LPAGWGASAGVRGSPLPVGDCFGAGACFPPAWDCRAVVAWLDEVGTLAVDSLGAGVGAADVRGAAGAWCVC